MWYSNDMFHYMFKAEFVMLVSLKVPSGSTIYECRQVIPLTSIHTAAALYLIKSPKYKKHFRMGRGGGRSRRGSRRCRRRCRLFISI